MSPLVGDVNLVGTTGVEIRNVCWVCGCRSVNRAVQLDIHSLMRVHNELNRSPVPSYNSNYFTQLK
jgi:hypothetical protein